MKKSRKVHNAEAATDAKVRLREYALEYVGGAPAARVLDAFAGRGMMHSRVWDGAQSYVGCDETWRPSDPGRRYCADNKLLLRAIDLAAFNVFDFDAFGSPWAQMLILARRRTFNPGERIAIVLTDGSAYNLRYGNMPNSMRELAGMRQPPRASGKANLERAHAVQKHVLLQWCREANVSLVKMWRAEGNGSGRGAQRMSYTTIGVEGRRSGAGSVH